jgi:hypothetical protein
MVGCQYTKFMKYEDIFIANRRSMLKWVIDTKDHVIVINNRG